MNTNDMVLPLRVGPQIETGIKLHSIRDDLGQRIALEVYTPHAVEIVRCVNEAPALRKFIERIALMSRDGEEREGSEPFIMENDDAVSTMGRLIFEAREITGMTP